MKLKPFILDSFALLAGAVLTLSFAPFNFFPLAILSPAILLFLWLGITPLRAFWRGWLFGLGFFATGVYWVFISVNTFGNTTLFISILITIALIATLALFPAVNGFFLNRYFPKINSAKILFAFPALWVLLEWIRSFILSGFPWLFLGYSQLNSPLKGYAPILSVYGISYAVALTSALLIYILLEAKKKRYKIIFESLIPLLFIWGIGAILSYVSWTKPMGHPVKVSLVQGNIAQDIKWSDDAAFPTMKLYKQLTEQHWDSQIIIWPESAIPLPLLDAVDYIDELDAEAKAHHATVITGIPVKAEDQNGGYYNAIIALGNGGGIYTKRRLVPFGEYVPLRNILGRFLELLHVPMSHFISGTPFPRPLKANGIKIAAFICYEIAYPEQVISSDKDIGAILTVSNDAWFGHSIAQAQHLEIARMRALEMGRPVLFGSNDGITAIILPNGNIQTRAPQYQTVVLTGDVQMMQGKTPWQYVSLDPMLIILFGSLAFAFWKRKKTL